MVSNQILGTRAAAGLLMAALAVSGCSHFRHREAAPAPAPEPVTAAAPVAGAAPAAAPAQDMTATEAAMPRPAAVPRRRPPRAQR